MTSRLVTGDVRERPILFSGEMVRALLSGTKTQTRRAVKPQPAGHAMLVRDWSETMKRRSEPDQYGGDGLTLGNVPLDDGTWGDVRCPYGKPGDRLWVRETWQHEGDPYSYQTGNIAFYRADYLDDPHGPDGEKSSEGRYRFWRPSIHMPLAVSRITLEITGVRVERLQDMEGQHPSESDALAEGVNRIHHGDGDYYYSAFRDDPHPKNWADPADAFRELWESINGPGSWVANPYVWAISFNRIKEPQ